MKTCEKNTYKSYAEAQTVVNKANKQGRAYSPKAKHNRKPVPKRVYKCELCGLYHLTSQLKKKSKHKRY